MKVIFPDDYPARDLHQIMLGSILPRPIALVSTISTGGIKNLAPFSYFNAISSLPPILAFSMSRRQDGTKKDTLVNLEEIGECVINLVNYGISHQMAIAGVNFNPDIDEFDKCGFTPVSSEKITPFGVKDSPVRFECRINKIIDFGKPDFPTSLAVCDVICIHIDENILDEHDRIDPIKMDLTGRLGRTNYLKMDKENIFSIAQSRTQIPMGFDKLPGHIIQSTILTGNEIATIAGMENEPHPDFVRKTYSKYIQKISDINSIHRLASSEIKAGNIEEASLLLFIPQYFDFY